MASDTTSEGFDYSGPVSKRAVQLMRELQGLKLFDTDGPSGAAAGGSGVAPGSGAMGPTAPAASTGAMGMQASGAGNGGALNSGALTGRKKKEKPNKLTSRFNRETYLRDTRSTYAGNLAVSILLLLFVLSVALVASWKVLLPKLTQLNEQVASIASAPSETASLKQQAQTKTNQQSAAQSKLDSVQARFMSPEQSLAAFTQFLGSLREGRVQLLSQKNSINQTTTNPYVAPAKAAGGKPGASPAPTVTINPGLNYNHYELSLSGSYSGYIFARQTLVGMVPNLIIHYEDIGAMDQNPTQLNIRVYLSLPFLAK